MVRLPPGFAHLPETRPRGADAPVGADVGRTYADVTDLVDRHLGKRDLMTDVQVRYLMSRLGEQNGEPNA